MNCNYFINFYPLETIKFDFAKWVACFSGDAAETFGLKANVTNWKSFKHKQTRPKRNYVVKGEKGVLNFFLFLSHVAIKFYKIGFHLNPLLWIDL